MSYFDELVKAMEYLSLDARVIFLGQSVEYPGNAMYKTLAGVSAEKRLEMPIAEDTQLGISIGLSLAGKIPISIYPRMDFLMLAMNQLVNHLDKIEDMSGGGYKPKVIIRTAIGSRSPMYPGVQHCQDYTEGLRLILKNVKVVSLKKPDEIMTGYMEARQSPASYLMVEDCNLYGMV